MKKICGFLIVLTCFCSPLLLSCTERLITPEEAEARKIRYETYLREDFKKLEYDGHEYIVYDMGRQFGITHNPDCKYCKEK